MLLYAITGTWILKPKSPLQDFVFLKSSQDDKTVFLYSTVNKENATNLWTSTKYKEEVKRKTETKEKILKGCMTTNILVAHKIHCDLAEQK